MSERYIIERDPTNGQYKILDTVLNLPIGWVEKKKAAEDALKRINQSYTENLTKKT